ncbi:Fatty acid hydroxylase superfamily [Orpheovirus IHUMI-LCC2]|uniref:Fatty acid hydroxylase superfamily n=1 Tax=Orpheovirus IHUMI-LCC2 TaxID=2023057 RepID=A0A2I2L359_9VIRU|nr:Fatty acid hydroxylase superfamily [Orpheovirus IHUMI-LCC2]SNW61972.1 Fatty acid hydroxylase superfamily [Orpheovirus IHUMI-LCC2]
MILILGTNVLIFIISCYILDYARNHDTLSHWFDKEEIKMTDIQKKKAEVTSINNISLLSILTYLIYPFVMDKILYNEYNIIKEIPKLIFMLLISDLMFYMVHRLMHRRELYSYIHKKHHKHIYTNVWSSFYFSKYELMLNWMFVFVVPITLLEINHITFFLYLVFITLSLVKSHSGINILNKYTSNHHDMHHLKFNGNYGSGLQLWDIIFKTNID